MDGGRQRSAFGQGLGGARRLACVALVASVGAAAIAEATPGDLDPSFSKDGKTYLVGDFSKDLAVQSDGSVVVAGGGSSSLGLIARVTGAGGLDKGFAQKGYIAKPFRSTSGDPAAVAIQPDGKIVVGGTVDRPASPFEADVALARYLPDGTPDPSFAGDGVATLSTASAGTEEGAADVAIQADGKIVVAGTASGFGIVARFNADGTPDNSFSGDGFVSSDFGFSAASLSAVGLGPAGSVYAAGVAINGANQPSDFLVVRIDTAGAPDPGFDSDGIRAVDIGSDDGASAIAVQADGNIVAGGFTKSRSAFARLGPTGALDPGFGGDGIVGVPALDEVGALGLAGDGSIYAIGGDSGILTIRLTPGGQLDRSFSGNGSTEVSLGGAPVTFGEALAVAPDGRVLIAGSAILSKDDAVVGVARLRVDDGPPDADADKVLDAKDECPGQVGHKQFAGCPKVTRKITVGERQGVFRGQITVRSPGTDLVRVLIRRCLFFGTVTVFERKPGADRKVGKTSASTGWQLDQKVRNGTYYARLKPQVYKQTALCGAARSKLLRR